MEIRNLTVKDEPRKLTIWEKLRQKNIDTCAKMTGNSDNIKESQIMDDKTATILAKYVKTSESGSSFDPEKVYNLALCIYYCNDLIRQLNELQKKLPKDISDKLDQTILEKYLNSEEIYNPETYIKETDIVSKTALKSLLKEPLTEIKYIATKIISRVNDPEMTIEDFKIPYFSKDYKQKDIAECIVDCVAYAEKKQTEGKKLIKKKQ